MLKDANKHMIEVALSDDEYFERMVLYLKPQGESAPRGTLLHAARWTLYRASLKPQAKTWKKWFSKIGIFFLGAAVCAAFFLLFG